MHSPTNTVQLEAAVGKKVEPGTKVMSQVSASSWDGSCVWVLASHRKEFKRKR